MGRDVWRSLHGRLIPLLEESLKLVFGVGAFVGMSRRRHNSIDELVFGTNLTSWIRPPW